MVAARQDGDADNMLLASKRKLKDVVKSLWKVHGSFMPSNQQHAPKGDVSPPYNGRIWVVDVPGFSQKAPESHSENGIRYTCLLAESQARRIGAENVPIITMYSYEVGLFRKSNFLPKGVAVQTVDSFQGLEDAAVILHCLAAFPKKPNPLGHISNEKCPNVALTRACELMLIVGNFSFREDSCLTRLSMPRIVQACRDFRCVYAPFFIVRK